MKIPNSKESDIGYSLSYWVLPLLCIFVLVIARWFMSKTWGEVSTVVGIQGVAVFFFMDSVYQRKIDKGTQSFSSLIRGILLTCIVIGAFIYWFV